MGTGRSRGQSEPLGVALIMAITILGALTAAVFGSAALADTEQSAEFEQAQQELTQFDSSASQVALGDTDVQSVSLGGSGGTYQVNPTAGHVTITHHNYTDYGDDEIIRETDLGAVIYEQDGRSIAYQGGGVWSRGSNGGGKIISPPEFHYRGATLTFPIVQIEGSDAVSGETTAVVRQSSPSTVIYPSTTTNYTNATSKTYKNPQSKGHIEVEVESRYYEAWATYFDQRTDGNVTVDEPDSPGAPGTVTVELVSLGIGLGEFDMPGEGGAIELRGLSSGHAVREFNITLRSTDPSADFNNLQWSLYAEDSNGDKQLEIHLRQNQGGACDEVTADAIFYFTEDGGDTYQSWKATNAFQSKCGPDGDPVLVANFTNSSKTMTYESIASNALLSTTPAKADGDFINPVTINPHSHDSDNQDGSDDTYDSTDSTDNTENMAFLVRHYIANFGSSIDLTVYDKNGKGGSVGEGRSGGEIEYGGSGQYVTYLHVTENGIEVEFN